MSEKTGDQEPKNAKAGLFTDHIESIREWERAAIAKVKAQAAAQIDAINRLTGETP